MPDILLAILALAALAVVVAVVVMLAGQIGAIRNRPLFAAAGMMVSSSTRGLLSPVGRTSSG